MNREFHEVHTFSNSNKSEEVLQQSNMQQTLYGYANTRTLFHFILVPCFINKTDKIKKRKNSFISNINIVMI